MKIIKKFLKITGWTFLITLILLILAPFLFKKQIFNFVQDQVNKNLNATVNLNPDKISISFIRNFPNVRVTLEDIAMTGKVEEFKGDTLFAAKQFSVVVDLWSVITGDQYKVKSIYLNQPKIVTMFAKNGKLSWDIALPDTAAVKDTATGEPTKFSIAISKWEIEDGDIIYDDRATPMFARLNHFNHTGKGDITQSIYDIATTTDIKEMTVMYDGTRYFNKHSFKSKADLHIDMDKSEYSFKENEFTINDFTLGIDGKVAMPTSAIDMDLKFASKKSDFKSLISLVPSVFMKGYESIKTEGQFKFDGYLKGAYDDSLGKMPAFAFNLNVDNGKLQYPDLPKALTNVFVDLKILNKDGVINNTEINLARADADMGSNPIRTKAIVKGLDVMDLDANVKAKVDLGEMTTIFPLDSMTLKGIFALDASAKGKYSDAQKLMPVVNAKMNLDKGYFQYAAYPEATLDNMSLSANAVSDGNLETSTANVDYFKWTLGPDPFEASAKIANFNDVNYDAKLKGKIDLAKVMKISPIEGMSLAGIIDADIATKGKQSDVMAGRYDKTTSSGSMLISKLYYADQAYMPQGMKIDDGKMTVTPEKINIERCVGSLGKSDMNVTGYLSSYMGYTMNILSNDPDIRDTVVRGKMNFNSNKFDVNEWMPADSAAVAATPAAAPAPAEEGIFEVPKDIDFALASNIKTVLYDNMTLTDLTGNIILRNGIMAMEKVNFNTLGGSIGMNGNYNTQNVKKPTFAFDMDLKNIAIKDAFTTFNTVQKLAPAAQHMDGKMATVLKISGDLGQDMMPVYSTLNGSGLATVASAMIKDNKVLTAISTATNKPGLNPLTVKDTKVNFTIENGTLKVKPFAVNAGTTKIDVKKGENKLDGTIDYELNINMPSGQAGAAAGQAINNLTGQNAQIKNIDLPFRVRGTYDKPQVTPMGGAANELVANAKEQVKEEAKEKLNEAKTQVTNEVKAQADTLKNKATNEVKNQVQNVINGQNVDPKQSVKNVANPDSLKKGINNIKNLPSLKKPFGK